jgi:general secretion pathway protein A
MYCDYFGFREKPFTIAPNPRYLYMSERHRDALAHLLFGVGDGGGFVVLTGEVGTGKTTLCRRLLEQLPPHVDVAYILNPRLSATELVQTICEDLGIPLPEDPSSLKQLGDRLNRFLIEQHDKGRKTVLIIDEAQNLAVDVLEQIRLLTNLETNEEKLLQIVLIGQPELRDVLTKNELRQLLQRVTARFHLTQLNSQETAAYVAYRLSVAGCERPVFDSRALKALYRYSGGIPRLVNVLADRALLGAYAQERAHVGRGLVRQAAEELGMARSASSVWRRFWWGAALAGLMVVATAGWLARHQEETGELTATSPETLQTEVALPVVSELDQALSMLQTIWKLPEGMACDQLAEPYRCEHGEMGWASVLALNVPVVLELEGTSSGYVVLKSIRGDRAVLSAGEDRPMDVDRLRARWTGRVWWLWPTPPGYRGALAAGSHGPAVAALKRALLLEQGISPEQIIIPEDARFDDALRLLVEQFQKRQGLRVDGVVGAQTWIRLQQVTNPGMPRLQHIMES